MTAGGEGNTLLGNYELNKTYCLDNVKGLQALPDSCIDLTVTSPPYDDMDLDFNPLSKNGLRTYNGYSWDFKSLAHELYRVTKPGGVCVWVVNDPTLDGSESLASSLQKIYFRRVGWNIETMIWNKGGFSDVGSLQYRYGNVFEYMLILCKGYPKTYNPLVDRKNIHAGKKILGTLNQVDGTKRKMTENGKVLQDTGIRFNIWEISPQKNGNKHPAPFPPDLARDHITSWSNPGDLVLDVFSGSGTTGKMAIEAGRKFIGFEISQAYTDLANRRIAGAKVPLFDWTSV